MDLSRPFLFLPLAEFIHHLFIRNGKFLRFFIRGIKTAQLHLHIMKHLFDPNLEAFRLFPLHPVSVADQLQRSRRTVGIDRAVVQQVQIQAHPGLKGRKQAETQIQLFLLHPFFKTPEHHGRRMLLQHLHIPDHIPVLRIQKLRQADPAAFFSEKDHAGIRTGFQHLRISQFSLCPVDLHFRFTSFSSAS